MKKANALPLALDYPEVRPLPPAANTVAPVVENLWLCIHLPYFALDVLAVDEDEQPHVVLYEQKGRWLIHTANQAAQAQGVVRHMALNAAYALCPEMQVHRRDYLQEQSQLKRLADWAYQFTPEISILAPQGLLLEVKGSLQLFGGLSQLLTHIQHTLQEEWAYHTQMSVTPAPLASQMLAQYGQALIVEQASDLRSVLAELPIEALLLEDYKLFQKLHNIGARQLQDLWRLPRPDLARRFGQALVKHLDQLLGLRPDIRARHEIPLCFDESLELPAEISDKKLILSSAELLLKRLVQYLQQQDAGLNRLLLRLYHYEHTATQVTLGLRQNSRNYQHILDLLQQQLDKVQLPSKVNALRLSVKDILPLEACASNLFPAHILPQEKQQNDPEWESLLEQLQNRLGPDALQYLDMRDDHRPEFAWCYQRGVSE
ncbi:MAG: DNA polymerase Y family protein, partial [Gammaproteobacteria bacterium]|nr:DNA polymerase Y family protein [Gammaproteobacteria bacterium]